MVWGVLLEVSCGGVSGLRTSRSCDEEQCTGTECSMPRVCPSLCRPSVQAGCLSHTPHFVQPPLQAVLRSVHPSIHPSHTAPCPSVPPPTHTHTLCSFFRLSLPAGLPTHPHPQTCPFLPCHAPCLSVCPCPRCSLHLAIHHAPRAPACCAPSRLSPPGLPRLSSLSILPSVRQSPRASLHPVRLSPRNAPSVLPLPMFGGRHALCLTHVPSPSGRD